MFSLIPYMFSLLLLIALMAGPASAQLSQCQILGSIIAIEDRIDSLMPRDFSPEIVTLNQNNWELAQIINDDIVTLILQGYELTYSSSVVGQEKWVATFTSSRAEVLNQYLLNNLRMSYQLKVSREYTRISTELKNLKGAVNCGFEAQWAGQLAFQQNELGSGLETDSNSRLVPTRIRQIDARILERLIRKIDILLPLASLLVLFVIIWGGLKYERYKENLRRRYYCHIAVKLVSNAKSNDCIMIDISRSGAGFILDTDAVLGDTIFVTCGSWSEKAHLIWRQGNSVGVEFFNAMKFVPEDFKSQLKRTGAGERKAKKKRKR